MHLFLFFFMKEQTDKSNTAGLCFHIASIVFVVCMEK